MPRNLMALCVIPALGLASAAHAAPPVTQQQMQALMARVAKLEADEAILRKQAADATASAQAAQAELARIKGATPGTPAVATDVAVQSDAGDSDLEAPETATAATTPDASAGTDALEATDASSAGANANGFNPAISVILNGSYSHHSLNPDDYVRSGFPGGAGPGAQGISLGESEVSLASNIDDKLYGQLTLTAASEGGQDHIGVEEAYIDTTSLPAGFSLRAGRFFSNIGYLNSHHTHTDSFFDRPLAYQAFLGNQYGDDGLQLRWVAPTSTFLEFGGEALRGQNYPSGGASHGGVGVKTLFAHAGGDVGTDNSWLAGVSVLKSRTESADDGFTGDETLYLADGTWKWAPGGNFKDGGVTVRGEYFLEDRDGEFTDPTDSTLTALWNGQRRGGYLEAVYRLNRTWDIGYRYDKLWSDNSGPVASAFDPWRHSAELTWRNSEFSLVRLQLSHEKPNDTDTDNALTLQYQVSMGAHGAHKF
ncbi:MAG: hypothetical protein ABJA62_03515 [Luteimonas sp.]